MLKKIAKLAESSLLDNKLTLLGNYLARSLLDSDLQFQIGLYIIQDLQKLNDCARVAFQRETDGQH